MNKLQSMVPLVAMLVAGCGTQQAPASSTKIVGGTEVPQGDRIAQGTVLLLVGRPAGPETCTGTLIDNLHVVTAAHCFDNWDAGVVGFGPGLGDPATVWVKVSKFVANVHYNSTVTTDRKDIGMVTLVSSAPAGFAPLPLFGDDPTDADLGTGETMALAGFGETSAAAETAPRLFRVDLQLLKVSTAGGTLTFGGSPGKSACMGDSGGPALATRNGRLVVAGISLGVDSPTCAGQSIYTDIRPFRPWVSDQLAP